MLLHILSHSQFTKVIGDKYLYNLPHGTEETKAQRGAVAASHAARASGGKFAFSPLFQLTQTAGVKYGVSCKTVQKNWNKLFGQPNFLYGHLLEKERTLVAIAKTVMERNDSDANDTL